jgi:hypothetical protein
VDPILSGIFQKKNPSADDAAQLFHQEITNAVAAERFAAIVPLPSTFVQYSSDDTGFSGRLLAGQTEDNDFLLHFDDARKYRAFSLPQAQELFPHRLCAPCSPHTLYVSQSYLDSHPDMAVLLNSME